jgi:type I restriction enzyme, S subunit
VTIESVRVGKVARLERRAVAVDPSETYQEIGVRSFGKGIFHKSPILGAALGQKRVFEIRPRDLVLSNVFAWEGGIAFAKDEELGKIGSHRFLTFTTTPGIADANYLRYFFLSELGLPLIQRASPGAAGRNRTLGIAAFQNLEIPLPDITSQQEIAQHLDHLGQRRTEVSVLARRAASLIKALHSAVCRVEAPKVRVGDKIAISRKPVMIDAAKSYRQIGIYSFGRGIIRRDAVPGAELSKLRYFELPAGALVLSNIQAWEGAIAVSPHETSDFIASNRFLSYVPTTEDVDVNYLRYYFLSNSGHPLIQRASPGTMVRNRTLGMKAFEDLSVPLPDLEEQKRISSMLDEAYEVLGEIERREKELDALLRSALNAAFSWMR